MDYHGFIYNPKTFLLNKIGELQNEINGLKNEDIDDNFFYFKDEEIYTNEEKNKMINELTLRIIRMNEMLLLITNKNVFK
jgi:hypothetical protein